MKISIISLVSAVQRRAQIADAMDRQSIPWEFFDACSGATPVGPKYVPQSALALRGRQLLPGEVGCYRSHWSLWQAMSEGPDEWRIIMEDDHVLDPSFDPLEVTRFAEELGIFYVRLASMYIQPFSKLGVFRGRQFVRFKTGPYGSGAYLLSREGAARFVAGATTIVRPVDDEMDSFWSNNVPVVAVYPQPALNLGMRSSNISAHGTRLEEKAISRALLLFFVNRLKRKTRKIIANVLYYRFDRRCRALSKKFP